MPEVGWLLADGVPFFPRATVRFGAGDWDHFVTRRGGAERTWRTMEALWEELEGGGHQFTAAHFHGLAFGRCCAAMAGASSRSGRNFRRQVGGGWAAL
jgi:hypothetical protein